MKTKKYTKHNSAYWKKVEENKVARMKKPVSRATTSVGSFLADTIELIKGRIFEKQAELTKLRDTLDVLTSEAK